MAETSEAESDAPKRAAGVIGLLDAAAPRIEAARELPPDVLAAMHGARLFRLLLPKSLGGDELDLATHARVIETIARGDASAAWVAGQGAGCAMAAAYLQPEAARRWFGAPDAVLAWGAGIQGEAVRVDGGYRVTGRWMFNSGSRHATALGGHSYVVDSGGRPVLRPDGGRLDRTVLVRRAQADIDDNWRVMGLCGTGSDTFALTDCFVPDADAIDRENPVERVEAGALYRFAATLVYGIGFAALQLGVARATMDALRDMAMTKTPRGVAVALRDNPVFQTTLAKLEARLRGARAYLLAVADEVYANAVATGEVSLADRAAIKLCTTHVLHEGVDVVTDAYRAAGSTAIFKDGPFERRLRDALTASQQTQARAQNFVTIGRVLMGLEPDSTAFL